MGAWTAAREGKTYQQILAFYYPGTKAWATGTLKAGPHIVRIWWAPTNTTGESIGIDAVDVIGTLN